MATFSSLPTEILLIILTDVHENHLAFIDYLLGAGKDPDDVNDPNVIWDLFYHLRARIPSPYALAAVCTRWRATLRLSPKFWTDVVLYTSGNNVLTHREVLANSDSLPIRIFITRDERSTKMQDFFEGCAVRHILSLCRPHMYRCTTLHIDVAYHHSLPPLQSIRGDTSSLTSFGLYTDSFTQSVDVRVDVEYNASEILVSNLKSLTSLTLDGFSFQQAMDNRPLSQWDQWSKEVRVLNINHFVKTSTTDTLVLYDIFENIATLKHLRVLGIRNLAVLLWDPERGEDEDVLLDEAYEVLNVHTLILEGLASDVTNWIFDNLTMPNIARLEFIKPRWPSSIFLPDARTITLKDYAPMYASFEPVLQWRGEVLVIKGGKFGVNDTLLKTLTEPRPSSNIQLVLGCHFLRTFGIEHCPLVTVRGLRNLVQGRGKLVDYSDPEWRGRIDPLNPALDRLIVTVSPSYPPLSQEDRQWFEDHLVDFGWIVSEPPDS